MPKGRSNLATVPPVTDFGVPSSRLQKLIDSTKKRTPYELTDSIVIVPPTRNSRQRMDELSYALVRNQTLLEDALRRTTIAAPTLDSEAPKGLAEGASEDQQAEHEAAVKAHEAAEAEFEQAVKDWESRLKASGEDVRKFSAALQADNLEWTKTLLGSSYDSVNEFLGEQEPELYDAVISDIRDHFQSDPEAPETGVCSKCGLIVDEDAAGKDTESST